MRTPTISLLFSRTWDQEEAMMSRSRRQGRGLGRRAAHLGVLAGLSLLCACGDNDGPTMPGDMGGGGDMTTVEPQKEPTISKSLAVSAGSVISPTM